MHAQNEPIEGPATVTYQERREQWQLTLERLQAQAHLSHRALHHSQQVLDRSLDTYRATVPRLPAEQELPGSNPPDPPEEGEERETRARLRLLEWEAADLREVVPEEMGTPRRQFAVALYETIRLAAGLGMSEDRLRYHLDYALDSYHHAEE